MKLIARYSASPAQASSPYSRPYFEEDSLTRPTLICTVLALSASLALVHAQAQDLAPEKSSAAPVKRLVADYDSDSKFLPAPYTYSAKQIP